MELRSSTDQLGGDAWTLQRLIRRTKPSRNQQKTAAANDILEAIAAARQDGRAPARLKLVVRKDDLKQVLEAIRDGRSSAPAAAALAVSLEQRLNLLRRRQILRGASHGRDRSRRSWRPALQSIPEE